MKGKQTPMPTQQSPLIGFIARWWILGPIMFASWLLQQSGELRPLLSSLVFVALVVFLFSDYRSLARERPDHPANDNKPNKRDPFTQEMMWRLHQMQKMGLSVEAMAIQAGVSEKEIRLKLAIR